MNLKCKCSIAAKWIYRYQLVILFITISFVCLCYGATLYQSLEKQKNAPFELKAVYSGKDGITDQLLSKINQVKGIKGVTIVQKQSAKVMFGEYEIQANIVGVNASYLNVALSEGSCFKDSDSSVRLMVNKAALVKLMCSSEDNAGDKKVPDISKEKWLSKPVSVQLAGTNHKVTGSICGILAQESATPQIYMTNSCLDQLSKAKKDGKEKITSPDTIHVRTENIGKSDQVSQEIAELGFSASNLNQSLLQSWKLLEQKEKMYGLLGLLSMAAGIIVFHLFMKMQRINEADQYLRLREAGASKEDLFLIELIEIIMVSLIVIILGSIFMIITRTLFYSVTCLIILLIGIAVTAMNLMFVQ
ncbi:hypothetical protein lbkm_4174 [Lachnospiraceae bacterium KM106-2]|nr:hypothetical protein lbkm_4174 [Lachnospiraceae bacterium KM106-2]